MVKAPCTLIQVWIYPPGGDEPLAVGADYHLGERQRVDTPCLRAQHARGQRSVS